MVLPTGLIPPCLPSKATKPPTGPAWVREIKHDGYRLMVRRGGSRVRCFTRNGHDWADRFPAIEWKDTPPASEPKKGELRLREATPEDVAEGKARSKFIRPSKLPENLRKSEAEIWELVRAA